MFKTWKIISLLFSATILAILLYGAELRRSNPLLAHSEHKNFNDTDGGRCLRNYYEDVLLVISYNYPFYSTIPFLRSHYTQAFPRLVVCGPRQSSHYDIMVAQMGPRGYYSYECLLNAVRLYPGYRGYLFVSDDMIVNWWNFAKLNKDRMWLGAQVNQSVAHEIGKRPLPNDWMWWKSVDGATNCENAYRNVTSLLDDPSTEFNIADMLNMHSRNGRNKKLCFRTWSDFVYIPGQFAQQFKMLTEIFRKNNVFLEIALPTIMSFLDKWSRFEKVYGVYLPDVHGFQDFSNAKYVWPTFNVDVPFVHPVKFSGDKGYRNRDVFKSRVIDYGRHFLYC